jgi:hypothetical protein
MRKLRWSALGLGCVLALTMNVQMAEAQVTGTVVTKDGEKHTGRNIGYRLDRREVAVRTSQDEEPRMNVDQVAYIDFGGAPAKDVNVTGTQQAIVMRDGNVIRGQVIEIGHEDTADEKTPYHVIVRTEAGEERRLPVNQVGRVYFASPSAVATTGTDKPQFEQATGEGIVVSARQQWTPTGMTVKAGERVTFQSSGQIQLSDDPKDIAGVAGSLIQRKAPNAPLSGNLAGALIGRIGPTGEPFPIGDQTAVTMPSAGQLFLGINDDVVDDNKGEFRVKVQRAGRR